MRRLAGQAEVELQNIPHLHPAVVPCCQGHLCSFTTQQLEMAPCRRLRRRKATRILLLLFLISTSPSPPLSRSLECPETTELRVPAADPCYERSYECKRREQLRSMLLTPAFMVLMAGLAVLFMLLSLDLVLKMVYVNSCSGVVKLMT